MRIENTEMKNKMQILTQENKLKQQIEEVNQYTRKDNVVIMGVPSNEKEDKRNC